MINQTKKTWFLKYLCILFLGVVSIESYAADKEVAQVESMIEGRLIMHVKLGQNVKKGQLLFQVGTTLNEMAIKQKENAVRYYELKYKREKILNKTSAVSVADYQKAECNYKIAIQNLAAAKITLKKRYHINNLR
jgi:multidrug efflux pump subunit AcrA (membrane-fusion protein)